MVVQLVETLFVFDLEAHEGRYQERSVFFADKLCGDKGNWKILDSDLSLGQRFRDKDTCLAQTKASYFKA